MKLHTNVKGEPQNPAVVLVHGLLGGSRNLSRLQDSIAADGFYTVAYDQRGHGHSEHGSIDSYNQTQLSDDLISVLDQFKVERAHLVGHSMGGRVSLITASRFPERILSLSMLDVGPRINPRALASLHSIIDPLPESFADRVEASEFLKENLPLTGKMKMMYEMFLLANLRAVDGRVKWVFDLSGIRTALLKAIDHDNSVLFKKIMCPILAARGELSEHFSTEEFEEMPLLNPNVRQATIPDAGHWVHADNFEGTFKVIHDFLQEVR